LAIESQTVVDLAIEIIKDMNRGYQSLMEMDAKIGGVGQHNVNQEEGDMVTGTYRIEFRGIFRPIQYVFKFIGYNDLVWTSRSIVLNSCLHVEKAIKYRFNIHEKNGSSLGVLLRNAYFGPSQQASRSRSDTVSEQVGHCLGANRPPPVSE
jgi:hypothetical protein